MNNPNTPQQEPQITNPDPKGPPGSNPTPHVPIIQPPNPVNPDPKEHPIHPEIPMQPIHEGTDPKRPIA